MIEACVYLGLLLVIVLVARNLYQSWKRWMDDDGWL